MGTTEIHVVPYEHQERLCYWGSGTGWPGRLWNLPPWRYSKTIWTRCWAAGSPWPCLNRGLDKTTFTGPFQSQPFCDSDSVKVFNKQGHGPTDTHCALWQPHQRLKQRVEYGEIPHGFLPDTSRAVSEGT